jgi:hypothetical protein
LFLDYEEVAYLTGGINARRQQNKIFSKEMVSLVIHLFTGNY